MMQNKQNETKDGKTLQIRIISWIVSSSQDIGLCCSRFIMWVWWPTWPTIHPWPGHGPCHAYAHSLTLMWLLTTQKSVKKPTAGRCVNHFPYAPRHPTILWDTFSPFFFFIYNIILSMSLDGNVCGWKIISATVKYGP